MLRNLNLKRIGQLESKRLSEAEYSGKPQAHWPTDYRVSTYRTEPRGDRPAPASIKPIKPIKNVSLQTRRLRRETLQRKRTNFFKKNKRQNCSQCLVSSSPRYHFTATRLQNPLHLDPTPAASITRQYMSSSETTSPGAASGAMRCKRRHTKSRAGCLMCKSRKVKVRRRKDAIPAEKQNAESDLGSVTK